MWMYHSHTHEIKDINTGLLGVMLVTGGGWSRADGSPTDVDREIVVALAQVHEEDSWLAGQNLPGDLMKGGPEEPILRRPEFLSLVRQVLHQRIHSRHIAPGRHHAPKGAAGPLVRHELDQRFRFSCAALARPDDHDQPHAHRRRSHPSNADDHCGHGAGQRGYLALSLPHHIPQRRGHGGPVRGNAIAQAVRARRFPWVMSLPPWNQTRR